MKQQPILAPSHRKTIPNAISGVSETSAFSLLQPISNTRVTISFRKPWRKSLWGGNFVACSQCPALAVLKIDTGTNVLSITEGGVGERKNHIHTSPFSFSLQREATWSNQCWNPSRSLYTMIKLPNPGAKSPQGGPPPDPPLPRLTFPFALSSFPLSFPLPSSLDMWSWWGLKFPFLQLRPC